MHVSASGSLLSTWEPENDIIAKQMPERKARILPFAFPDPPLHIKATIPKKIITIGNAFLYLIFLFLIVSYKNSQKAAVYCMPTAIALPVIFKAEHTKMQFKEKLMI